MKVQIKRFTKDVSLPEYKTVGAVALDCPVENDAIIQPHTVGVVPLNFALQPPADHFVLLAARSSLHKRGLMFANGVGIFDADYCGDEDQYKAILYNFSDSPVEIKKGERVAQIVFVPYSKVEWEEKEILGNPSRGGIGSTGNM